MLNSFMVSWSGSAQSCQLWMKIAAPQPLKYSHIQIQPSRFETAAAVSLRLQAIRQQAVFRIHVWIKLFLSIVYTIFIIFDDYVQLNN